MMNARLSEVATKVATMLEISSSGDELEGLTQMLISAQEDERQRIAADLHDGVGQCLSVVQFALEGLKQQIGHRLTDADKEKFECLAGCVAQTIDEVRRISMDLRPPMLDDLGVLSAIDWFCSELRQVFTNIDVVLRVNASEDTIPTALKVAIFRIMQEACSNACKYSRANQLSVLLETDAEGIRLEVVDNGVGFDPGSMKHSRARFGLFSMRERATLTDGCLFIRSKPGKGTRVLAAWPESKAAQRVPTRLSIA